MPNYKLYYYNGRGLAEVPRWLFAVAGQPYDDVRLGEYCVDNNEWLAFKSSTPFGQLPVLDVDDLRIAQSNTIVHFLARELDLAGKSPEERVRVSMVVDYVNEIVFKAYRLNFENDETKKAALKRSLEENFKSQFPYLEKFTESYGTSGYLIGDSISLADVSFAVGIEKLNDFNLEFHLENYPRLKQAYDKILAHPGIVAWIAKRPVTKT